MSKKRFRPKVEPDKKAADYPTLDQVETDRRGFLSRLGLAILGAGTFGAGLAACDGGRPVGNKPDIGSDQWEIAGGIQAPDLGSPPAPDAGVPGDDSWRPMGEAPMPDAGPRPDQWEIGGDVEAPDAGIAIPDSWEISGGLQAPDSGTTDSGTTDSGTSEPDMMELGGVAPMPDSGSN